LKRPESERREKEKRVERSPSPYLKETKNQIIKILFFFFLRFILLFVMVS